MKKFMLSTIVMLFVSMYAMAQDAQNASYSNNSQTNYSIVMNKDALSHMLSLTSPMADKMDAWQNALQQKIDESLKMSDKDRATALKAGIGNALAELKEMLGSESYNKYVAVFRNTLKSRKIDELMK